MTQPTRADEVAMMMFAVERRDAIGLDMWRHFVDMGGMNDRRYHYVLEKWEDRGWWDCGVSTRCGWLTDKGRVALARILAGSSTETTSSPPTT